MAYTYFTSFATATAQTDRPFRRIKVALLAFACTPLLIVSMPAKADPTPECNEGAGTNSTECGTDSTTGLANGATAVGAAAAATGTNATAVGAQSSSSGTAAVAVGGPNPLSGRTTSAAGNAPFPSAPGADELRPEWGGVSR